MMVKLGNESKLINFQNVVMLYTRNDILPKFSREREAGSFAATFLEFEKYYFCQAKIFLKIFKVAIFIMLNYNSSAFIVSRKKVDIKFYRKIHILIDNSLILKII